MAVEEENSCLELEDIAAYLDGLLAPADRQRVIRHLANCPVCFEVYAGAARFQLDEQAGLDDDGARVENADPLPFERPPQRIATPPVTRPGSLRRRVRWIAAAAAAVLAAALGLGLERWMSDPQRAFSSSSLVADLARGKPPAGVGPFEGHVTRGPGDAKDLSIEQSSFRLGVGQLDLGLALRNGKRDDAETALRHLVNLCSDIEPRAEPQSCIYAAIRGEVSRGTKLAFLAVRAREIEERDDEPFVADPAYVALGRWSEACRVAAAPFRAELLGSRATSRLLDEVLREDAANQKSAATATGATGAVPAPLTSADDSSLALPNDLADPTLEGVDQTLATLRQNIAAKRLDQAADGCKDLLGLLGSD